MSIVVVTDAHHTRPPRAFTGKTDLEMADEMAGWLTDNDHRRPFFRDREFVREFGTITRKQAEAAVNSMWARADRAAAAAGIGISLPARLGGSDNERT